MQTYRNRAHLNRKPALQSAITGANQAQAVVLQLVISKPSIKNASARALSILSPGEVRDLLACEEIIAKGWDTFISVGRALAEIRDKRLYRADFETFDTYCRQKWNYGKSQAYRLIGAAEVVQHLSPIGDIPLPRNEAQVRPLLGLKPDEVKAVWREVVQKAGKSSVTAKLVKQMADQLKSPAAANVERTRKMPTAQEIEAALLGAEELLRKARQSFKAGDNAAVIALLHQISAQLRSSRP